jgi:hypothetical protein
MLRFTSSPPLVGGWTPSGPRTSLPLLRSTQLKKLGGKTTGMIDFDYMHEFTMFTFSQL